MVEDLNEALALMRRALELIDRHNDPYVATPHLDLAISRLESGTAGGRREDDVDHRTGNLAN